jgi:hypothetical protein
MPCSPRSPAPLQASARPGLVHTIVAGDRVLLAGCAVTVVDGTC